MKTIQKYLIKIKDKFDNTTLIKTIIKILLIWFLVTFIIFPNLNLLTQVFIIDGKFSFDAFAKVWNSNRAMKSLFNSLLLAVSLVVTVNIIGTLIVLFTEYFEIKGSKILRIGYMSTLVYGGVVLVSAYKFLYGDGGILTNLLMKFIPNMDPGWFKGYFAVLFIMTFSATSNHMIFLRNAIRGLDFHIIEAAKNMGASATQVFIKIVFPILKPTFFAVTTLTFLAGLGAMAAPIMVGGPDFQTINPMIMMFAKTSSSREVGAFLAIILGLLTMGMLFISNKAEQGGNYVSISKTKTKMKKQKITNPTANILAHIIAYTIFIIYITPVVLVGLYSISDSIAITTGTLALESFTLENFKRLFTDVGAYKPYLISIVYGISASLIATTFAFLVSRLIYKSKSILNTFLEYATLIPWLLPSTLIALGLMLTYNSPVFLVGNKVLVGTTFLLLFGYVIVKLPFSFRMIRSSLFSIEDSLEEASQSLGASPFYTLRKVVLPIILPFLVSVLALNFNSLLSDYDLTVFLSHPLFKPLGLVIKAASDELASTNAIAMTFVYTVILMIISTITLYFSQRTRSND